MSKSEEYEALAKILPEKIAQMDNDPFIWDTGDAELDRLLS